MAFDQNAFNTFVIEHKLIGFFEQPLKLKSGRLSNWYVNWRTAAEDVYLMDQLTDFVVSFVKTQGLDVDCFYGVPEGATKLGILTQYKWAKADPSYGVGSAVLSMGRAKPKEHGDPKDKFFVGMPKGKTTVLEDVTTTGGSLIETLIKLKDAGIDVVAAIGLTNRDERRDDGDTVADALAKMGIAYHAMSHATELLRHIRTAGTASDTQWDMAQQYFTQYGTEQL
jgi:orotate phosphoribosyltransferase